MVVLVAIIYTLCVYWIGVCHSVLLWCVGLYKGLLCVGGCKWRVGVAKCLLHGLDKVCCWHWDMIVVRRYSSHILVLLEI